MKQPDRPKRRSVAAFTRNGTLLRAATQNDTVFVYFPTQFQSSPRVCLSKIVFFKTSGLLNSHLSSKTLFYYLKAADAKHRTTTGREQPHTQICNA